LCSLQLIHSSRVGASPCSHPLKEAKMAKYINSGLISFIKGSIGDYSFNYWRGIPCIKRKPKRKRKFHLNPHHKKTAEALFMLQYYWKNMDLKKRSLWALYSKRYTKMKTRCKDGLCTHIGNKMAPYHAFISVNLLLISSGFKHIYTPPTGIPVKPPCPSTDLLDCQIHENKVEFYIWLPHSYHTNCIAQIWIRESYRYSYIAQIIKLSTSKTLVTISQVKTKVKKKMSLKKNVSANSGLQLIKLENMESCTLYIQMRTVADNGEFSIPSPIYKLQVKSTKLKRKTPKRILNFFRNYY